MIVGFGCSTALDGRLGALLPPGSVAQLELRLDEARRAEKMAQEAGDKLRDRLAEGRRGEAIGVDVDRVEVAAFEFERRVASARDAAERCRERGRLAGELQRLERRSRELAEYVRSLHVAGPSASAARLEAFLRSS